MYTVKALKEDRNDNSFEIFWEYVIFMCKKLSIEQPVQQRKRKLPVRFDENQVTYHHPETPKEEYRKVYFECIDYLVNSIETRFNQPDYQIYLQMQELLLKSFRSESCNEELTELTKRYADDVDFNDLKTQLNMLPQISKKKRDGLQKFEYTRCYYVYAVAISIRERIFIRSRKNSEIDPTCTCN